MRYIICVCFAVCFWGRSIGQDASSYPCGELEFLSGEVHVIELDGNGMIRKVGFTVSMKGHLNSIWALVFHYGYSGAEPVTLRQTFNLWKENGGNRYGFFDPKTHILRLLQTNGEGVISFSWEQKLHEGLDISSVDFFVVEIEPHCSNSKLIDLLGNK